MQLLLHFMGAALSANVALVQEDSTRIAELLGIKQPADRDLIDAARLIQRYRHTPQAEPLQLQLLQLLEHWGLSASSLFAATRELWASGNAGGDPARRTADALLATPVGSGADLES